jgi:hypothetical protein
VNIIERLGYMKRAEHEEVLRHKDDMHRELGARHDRIQALEHGLRCARAEAERQRRPTVCQQCRRPFGHSSYVASEPEANGGLLEFCSPACRHDWLVARAKDARPIVDEPEDWLQAGPGAKCLWCDKPKPQICEWAMDPRGRDLIRRFFCDSQCRKAFVLASTVSYGLPGPIDLSPGKIRQSPQQKARQCRQCQKPIPFHDATIWAHTNETTATDIVSGQSVRFPFCSPGCLKCYRSGEPRMNDMMVDFAPKESASFSVKKLWAETLAALKKHGEEMDAMAAMWGAAGVDSLSVPPTDRRVFTESDVRAARAEVKAALADMQARHAMKKTEEADEAHLRTMELHNEAIVSLRTVRHSLKCADEKVERLSERLNSATDEMHRLHDLAKKLQDGANEDQRRIEELRCQAGDLSDRLENVEHERDAALFQRDNARRTLIAKSQRCVHLQTENHLLRTHAAQLTDDEAASVVMPLMADFENGEDYIKAVWKALDDVVSRRI